MEGRRRSVRLEDKSRIAEEASTAEASTAEASMVEARDLNPVEACMVEASTAEASTAEASMVEASTAGASMVEASTAEASMVQASTAEASMVEASTAEASMVKASMVEASTAEASMVEALPDEILTLIFSKLSDGHALLDAVPLVCKRWCRVARDPASWAGVRLVVKAGVHREARLLRFAPAAQSLEIEAKWSRRAFTNIDKRIAQGQYGKWGPYGPNTRCRLRAALRFTRVVIRDSVAILEKGWWLAKLPEIIPEPAKKPRSSIARFLVRQPGLRALRLLLAAKEEGAACLAALARMRRLETLELVTASGAAYNGELADGMPALRELRLHARCPRDTADPRPPRGLVADLVRGAPALRVLEVDMPAVGADREACAALPRLERVVINAFENESGRARPSAAEAVAAVRRAFEFLLQMKTPALRSATVSLCRGEHARFSTEWQDRFVAVRDEFSLLMNGVELTLLADGPDCGQCGADMDCPGLAWDADNGSDGLVSDDDSINGYGEEEGWGWWW